jgi:hypothetical protein
VAARYEARSPKSLVLQRLLLIVGIVVQGVEVATQP